MKNMKEDRQETTQQTKSQCHREREEEPVTIQHQLFLTYLLPISRHPSYGFTLYFFTFLRNTNTTEP
jgi:hypothetical protein